MAFRLSQIYWEQTAEALRSVAEVRTLTHGTNEQGPQSPLHHLLRTPMRWSLWRSFFSKWKEMRRSCKIFYTHCVSFS